MDFSQIQNMLKNDKNARFVIFDSSGKPTHIIVPFSEYERLSGGDSSNNGSGENVVSEDQIPKETQAGFEEVEDILAGESQKGVRIEDLPF